MKPFSLILLPNGTTQEQNENLLDRYILSSSQSHKLPLSCVILTLQLSLETMQAILIGGQYQNIDLPMMLPIFLTWGNVGLYDQEVLQWPKFLPFPLFIFPQIHHRSLLEQIQENLPHKLLPAVIWKEIKF